MLSLGRPPLPCQCRKIHRRGRGPPDSRPHLGHHHLAGVVHVEDVDAPPSGMLRVDGDHVVPAADDLSRNGPESGRGAVVDNPHREKGGAAQSPAADRRGSSRRVHWSGRTQTSRAIENSTHCANTAESVHAMAKPRTFCREPFAYLRSTQSAGAGDADSVIPSVGASSWRGGTNWCVVGGRPCQPAALATHAPAEGGHGEALHGAY